ncbi:hypothetical protein [Azohydromonas australica]|uniref:hypothetical protein n=1 Tax=Azohydromonas australica TaxID=364039 RepID=UPI0003FBEB9A|nr:hypothetical protein [Azohydromonas australica]
MVDFDFSPSIYSFKSTFAGIPVEIQYEIEVNEDHRGRDVVVIPTTCVIGSHEVDLCEDAGFFHPEQLRIWLAQAEADHEKVGEDDGEPDHFFLREAEIFLTARDSYIPARF